METRIDTFDSFFLGGGELLFCLAGAICLVYSDNERDSSLLNSGWIFESSLLLRGISGV